MRRERQRLGAATVEHAVVLGLITLLILGGAMTVGVYMQRSMTPMAAGLAVRTADPGTSNSASRTSRTDAVPTHALLVPTYAGTVASLVAVALAVIAGWLALRWSRRGPLPGVDRDLPETACSPDDLLAQLYLKRQALLRFLENCEAPSAGNPLEVRQVMTEDITTVAPETPLAELIALMGRRGFRHLVVGHPSGKVLGVISDRDLRNRSGTTAREMMSSPAITVAPDTAASTAITCLIQRHISCLPVVDGTRLCGVVTTTDLMLVLQCLLQLCLRSPAAAEGESRFIELAT